MGIEMISILLFGGMFLLLALGLPVAFVLGGLATVFTADNPVAAEVVAMLGQQRYALALGTAALHLLGSLLLTIAGLRSATYLIAARA